MKNNKSAEPNTAEQIQFMTGLIKQVSQPMIATSADRRLLYWNAAFSKLTGYNNKELSDPIISAGLTAPEWHESETKAFEKLQRTGKSQTFQKEYIRKDGVRVPVEVLVYQLSEGNGKVQYYIGLITDITERKQLEEALLKSESHYRILVENAIEGIVVIQDGEIKFVNPIVAIATGYSSEEMLSMSLKELLYPDNEKAAVESISQAVVPGTLLMVPLLKIRTKGGGTRLIEATIISIIWDDKPANLNLLRDITERHQSEETLRQSEKKYRSILEDVREGYWEVDLAGNFISFNEAICRLLGYSENEMAGTNYRAYTSAEYVDKVYQAFNQIFRTAKPIRNMHYEIVQKDGSKRFAETSVFPERNDKGEVIGFRGVSHDITERQNIEEALIHSEERYRTILDEMQDGYFEVDLAGNYTFTNEANCRNLGYPREELIGVNYRATTAAEDIDKVYQAFNQVYRTGQSSKAITFKVVQKDGSTGQAEILASPLRNKKGEIIGFRGIGRDITERMKMEESLRRSEEKYRSILETIEESYYEVDLAGSFTFVNDTLCRQFGYSREELMGMNYKVYTPAEISKKVFGAYNQVYRTGEPLTCFPMEQIRKDGTRLVLENSVLPIRNEKGEIIGFRGIGRDVTERKQLEETLRQSEERYRTILEEIHDDYFENDLNGNYIFVNDAFCRSVGYTRDELIGMNYKVIIASDDIERIESAYIQIYRTGQPIEFLTSRFVRKDGSSGISEASAFPIRNERGKITGFRGISRDVTKRKQIEEALRQSEERYRTVLEDMDEAYYELDVAGNYTFFNDALCSQLGYSREELMGMNYKTYTPPEDIDRVFKAFNLLYRTGEPLTAFHMERIKKDGTSIFAETSGFPLKNERGDITGFRGVVRDITKRLQMEETLRRSEERYRTLLEEMEEPYYEVDLAGNYTFFNDALCRKLGYSREEMKRITYKVYTVPEDIKIVFQAYNQVYRTGTPIKWFPSEQIRKDRARVFAETSVFPLRNKEGKIIGFRGVSRDITERKKAEEEKKQMEQKAQFASRLASVGELASGVAHEINNPLTGVIGYAHLLLARKDLSRDVRRDLEIINEGAQRVAGIVKKLLAFARQTKPEQRYVNINELIRNTLDLRAYELSASNIKVALQLTRDLPVTIADPGQLQQVFLNLIINAETEMKITHDKGRLSIKTEKINNTLRIVFKDSGPGIARENLETIFDPFFTTREVGQGTGLGLSVCHGIVTEHNGKIWAESEPGKGATFIIELPLVTEEGQFEPPEPVIEEAPRVAKARILVVDDEPVIRQFVSQVLGEQGHTVETVDNAASALKMVKSKRYRLILLDIKMPGMSGVELYKQFQKIAPSLTKRVVFITGDVMGKRTMAFLDKTKTPYMMKPFDARELKTQINRILARK
jgi:PAS domain S-box-containing protein